MVRKGRQLATYSVLLSCGFSAISYGQSSVDRFIERSSRLEKKNPVVQGASAVEAKRFMVDLEGAGNRKQYPEHFINLNKNLIDCFVSAFKSIVDNVGDAKNYDPEYWGLEPILEYKDGAEKCPSQSYGLRLPALRIKETSTSTAGLISRDYAPIGDPMDRMYVPKTMTSETALGALLDLAIEEVKTKYNNLDLSYLSNFTKVRYVGDAGMGSTSAFLLYTNIRPKGSSSLEAYVADFTYQINPDAQKFVWSLGFDYFHFPMAMDYEWTTTVSVSSTQLLPNCGIGLNVNQVELHGGANAGSVTSGLSASLDFQTAVGIGKLALNYQLPSKVQGEFDYTIKYVVPLTAPGAKIYVGLAKDNVFLAGLSFPLRF